MKTFNTTGPRALNDIIERGKRVHLIDVRTPAEYRAGHAAGAISIPLDQLTPDRIAQRLGDATAGHDSPVYLTCQSGLRAEQAAHRLMHAGIDNLYLVDGGTEAWSKADLPMQRCGNAIALERQVQIAIGALLVLKVLFGFTIHELFFAAIPLIGAGLIVAGLTRWCGMARLIAMMPWNKGSDCAKQLTV
jgi:rhodanese-related sulfurtransferase